MTRFSSPSLSTQPSFEDISKKVTSPKGHKKGERIQQLFGLLDNFDLGEKEERALQKITEFFSLEIRQDLKTNIAFEKKGREEKKELWRVGGELLKEENKFSMTPLHVACERSFIFVI